MAADVEHGSAIGEKRFVVNPYNGNRSSVSERQLPQTLQSVQDSAYGTAPQFDTPTGNIKHVFLPGQRRIARKRQRRGRSMGFESEFSSENRSCHFRKSKESGADTTAPAFSRNAPTPRSTESGHGTMSNVPGRPTTGYRQQMPISVINLFIRVIRSIFDYSSESLVTRT